MQLTKNFSLSEAQTTTTGLNNVIPNTEIMENVKATAEHIMQPLRDFLNIPITVNSWFRSLEVNRAVGGVSSSKHTLGEAVDFTCTKMLDAFDYIRYNLIFDQLIWEVRGGAIWIHVSYTREGKNRMQVMKARYNKVLKKMIYEHLIG